MNESTERLLRTQLRWWRLERAPIVLPIVMGIGLVVPFVFFAFVGWLHTTFGW